MDQYQWPIELLLYGPRLLCQMPSLHRVTEIGLFGFGFTARDKAHLILGDEAREEW